MLKINLCCSTLQWGFKRVGQRVTLDTAGNLVLRPRCVAPGVCYRMAIALRHTASCRG